MTWSDFSIRHPAFVAAAERVCTPAELDVLKMRAAGYSWRRTAEALQIHPSTARSRWESARRKLIPALADELPRMEIT